MDSKNEKISIVVPIYNVKRYISASLNSILAQSYTNIEILLVDDGSTDGSGAICDQFLAKDSRIRVFHIENGGVAKARELGVQNSSGEYIVFVDPDDTLPCDAIKSLYSAIESGVDLVVGSACFCFDGKENQNRLTDSQINGIELTKQLLRREITIIGAPWGKLYRKKLFEADSFPNFKRSQDWLMNIEVSSRVKSARLIPNIVYNYNIYDSSVSHKSFPDSKYWEQYTKYARQIIEKRGDFHLFELEYHSMCLMILFESIMNGSYISIYDKWVAECYIALEEEKLSTKNRLILWSLKSKNRQNLLKLLINLTRKLRGLSTK